MPVKKLVRNTFIFATLPLLSQTALANFETSAKQAYLVDQKTQTVLYAKEAYAPMTPSSMTKLMTVYILLDHVKKGAYSLTDTFITSKKAWKKKGSKMFLKHKERVTVEDLIYGVLVHSGNDAAIVVAENLAVSEAKFAKLMNKTAKKLGLTETHFVNATGWPDEGHTMSPKDIVKLSEHIINDFPEYYHYFSKKTFTHNNIKQNNRNILLGKTIGVDGLKTGHTEMGGYGVALSAQRDGRRIIGVVNGLSSEKERASEAERLLNYGFRYFENKTLFNANQEIAQADIWLGEEKSVGLVSKEDILLSIPKVLMDELEIKVTYNAPLPAPVSTEESIATLHVNIPDFGTHEYPLYAAKKIQPVGWIKKIFYITSYYIKERL
jgi:D-alanyl-D-alanine carboxypeptidase (penicillin-binding protein 5/6)